MQSANWSQVFDNALPIIQNPRKCGETGATFIPALDRYLLVAWNYPGDPNIDTDETRLIFYESPAPWGPWTLVTEDISRPEGWYCPRVVSKWQRETENGSEIEAVMIRKRDNMASQFSIPKSSVIKGLEWTGDRLQYPDAAIKGDTFPMTWGGDGEIYTSAGDPWWGESVSGLDIEKFSGGPTDYKISKVHHMNDYLGWGGDGPKPSGMICVDGVLYFSFQNMLRTRVPPHSLISQHGSDAQIICSTNKGRFWVPTLANISTPMFAGHKFGGPSFVQFGQNNANARDEFVYAVSSDQWDNGSIIRLGRVPKDRIMRREAWEWVCAFNTSGEPAWHSNLDEAIPVLTMHRWLGLPEMVYLAGIQRYLLLTWHLHADFSPDAGTDLLVLESQNPWGPFSLVHYEEYWEGKEYNPYCPRVPLKWMEPDFRRQQNVSSWIITSDDYGLSWNREATPLDFFTGRLSSPHFIQLGQDYAGARDEYVYASFPSAEDGGPNNSPSYWKNGDFLLLGRAPQECILERAVWEFYSGIDRAGQPLWSRDDGEAQPIFSYFHMTGEDHIVYNPGLKRYLLGNYSFIDAQGNPRPYHQAWPESSKRSQLTLFESPEPWGPWSLFYCDDNWGNLGGYQPNFTQKWMSADGKTMWMIYSGSWADYNFIAQKLTLETA